MKRCCWALVWMLAWGCQGETETEDLFRTKALGEAQDAVKAEVAPVAPGIVVEKVAQVSAPGKAGIQSGDILLAWKRLPNPPANPEAVEGEFHSPFDWHEVQLEQAPRGAVEILGERGGIEKIWRIEPGSWRSMEVQPGWTGNRLKLYHQGRQQIEEGNLEDGAKAWQDLVESLDGGAVDHQRLWMLFEFARFWLGAGNEQPQAVENLERILELLKAQDAYKLEFAYVQQKLGDEFEKRVDLDRAHDLYSLALQIRQQLAPQSLQMAYSLNDLGILAWKRGDLEKAEELFTRSLQIREQVAPESLSVASSLNNFGVLASIRGDLEQAAALYTRSLRIKERLAPGSLTVASTLGNLGNLAAERGYFDEAQELHTRTLRIREELAPGSPAVAVSLQNLGLVARDRGDQELAYSFLSRAQEILEQTTPAGLEMAAGLFGLGAIAQDRGHLDEALEIYTRVQQIFENLAPRSPDMAMCLQALGGLARDRGDLDEAQKFLTDALRIAELSAPESLTVAVGLRYLGDLAIDQGHVDQALEAYTRTLEIREVLAPQSYFTAESLNRLAAVALLMGDLDLAANYFLRSLNVLEQQIVLLGGSYSLQATFRAQQQKYYRETLETLVVQERLGESFHVLERLRARTFLTMLAERDIAFKADLPEDLDRERRRLAVRHDRTLRRLPELSAHEDAEQVAAIRQELETMDGERSDIEERIRRASPRLGALQYPQPLTADAAQKALDPGTLLVSYAVGEESTSIFALSQEDTLEVKTIPLSEGVLRRKVEQLRELIPDAIPDSQLGQGRTQSFQALSRELYRLLLKPVAERIERSQRLLILPDGPLHAFPFAVLIRGDGDEGAQYLIEWKPLHIALSVTAYAELKKARPPAHERGPASVQLVAFGDPSYPEAFNLATVGDRAAALPQDAVLRSVFQRAGSDFEWRSVPYTRREVQGIAELFPQTQVFLGPEALEERVKSLGPGVRILHLAAHAYTDDRLPLSSFVALTIPEDLPEGRDNGLLQAWEILEQVRIDADLVVLSGCLTGMGTELRGEGLIGLTRAFQYAGARSLMSTLWAVSDQATAELMVRFYRHLRSGLPKDEALRAAQLELLREPIMSVDENGQPEELKHASAPFYWAGVQLYGDWM